MATSTNAKKYAHNPEVVTSRYVANLKLRLKEPERMDAEYYLSACIDKDSVLPFIPFKKDEWLPVPKHLQYITRRGKWVHATSVWLAKRMVGGNYMIRFIGGIISPDESKANESLFVMDIYTK